MAKHKKKGCKGPPKNSIAKIIKNEEEEEEKEPEPNKKQIIENLGKRASISQIDI